MAGIIAAQNNNLGTVGIAYNVKIMPIKALNHEGVTNDTDIINAVKYAMENGAEIINMSFGQQAMGLSSYDLFDTKQLQDNLLNNRDGVLDTGETVALGLTLRNRWGESGKTTDADLLVGWEDPFYITVAEECPGTTTIVAEDLRTSLYASFLLIVIEEEELPKIKDVQFYDTYHHVLMENGDLYFWSANHEVPELILEGVEMFDQDGGDLIAVMIDGSQLLYDHGSIYPITYGSSPALDNPVDIQFKGDYPRTGYALTADGYVYFNPGGNFVTASSELLNLENVVQMSIQRNYSLFLTENGDLY